MFVIVLGEREEEESPSVVTGTLLEQILAVKPIVQALAFTLQLNFSGSNNLFKL